MICILGCLDNEAGLEICKEMRSWLDSEHSVFVVHQNPPGNKFEYPAIKCALETSVLLNEPVLYLHTKGAGNKVPRDYKNYMMSPKVNYPKDAKPEDCQRVVRMMWQKEFTGENLKKYLDALNTDKPTVACPLTGKEKITWQNGWIINSAGAKELLKTFHLDNNRYYYEHMFRNTNIDVIGIVSNKCDINNLDHTYMWNLIWTYFNK